MLAGGRREANVKYRHALNDSLLGCLLVLTGRGGRS
jgi:hypothetical protein